MRRVAFLLAIAALFACVAAASAAAAPFPAATPVVGSDGAVLAVAVNAKDVHGALDGVINGVDWGVSGTISVYVPGETVSVAVYRDGVLATTQTVPIDAATTGTGGAFTASFVLYGTGALTVQATHALSAQQELLVSAPVYLTLARSNLRAGQRSLAARILQLELTAAHFVVGRPGVYDARTQRAVLAFRKLADMPRTMVADRAVFKALAAGRGKFKVRYPLQGRHAEGDLTHQVLALIGPHGEVQRIYPMSSGKPSTPTQPGLFRVWLRTPGVNNDDMVDSSFFNGGDAIHGYNPDPPYAASHGCLRVPVPDALSIYDWIGGTGVPVDVYYRGQTP
jgi:hypothetical protein